MLEQPGEYCANGIKANRNLQFIRVNIPNRRPGECEHCLADVYPQSKSPIAALPPGTLKPGKAPGRYAARVALTARQSAKMTYNATDRYIDSGMDYDAALHKAHSEIMAVNR